MESSTQIIDLSDALDGPTAQHQQHHDVVARSGNNAGKRIRGKVEMLFNAGYLSPEQAAAGHRFTIDYLKGVVGRSKSCLDVSIGGNGAGYPSEERHQAAANFEKARVALDGSRAPYALGLAPSAFLIKFCIEDAPLDPIADELDVRRDVIKSRIAQLIAVLTVHYAAVDRERGRSATPQTAEAVLSLLDPDRPVRHLADQE